MWLVKHKNSSVVMLLTAIYFTSNLNSLDPNKDKRIFGKENDNMRLTDSILSTAITHKQCVFKCLQDDKCVGFSYHGDLASNNCLLGSATASTKDDNGWTIYIAFK